MKTHSEARIVGSSSQQRVVWSAVLVGLGVAFASEPVYAHVKWFASYDVAPPPLAVAEVLTPQFVRFFLGSILFVYGYFWFDRLILRQHVLETALARLKVSEATAGAIMRGAAFIFFGAAGVYGLTTETFLLTPELKAADLWVPWLQLVMAACALHRRALPGIGLGIAAFYVVAVSRYGIFHLLDYLIFLGVAYYFAATAAHGPGWTKSRYITLYATTGLTLLWASIEKWGYAAWTLPLLGSKPDLLMGLDPGTYMILAGFVEFNVTFLLLSSVSLVSRIVALGLLGIFALAIYEFGLIDAIGHLLIMAILFVLVIYGPTTGRNFLAMPEKSLWVEAYFMTGLYALAFVLIFIAYYGIHALAY